MTVRALSLLVLLAGALGACASSEAMPDAQCRLASENDATVRDKRASNAGKAAFNLSQEDRADLGLLQADAYTRCLRLRGLAPAGGVERSRPAR